jgi:Phytanoyl-CoA dioxygenase (PhyH)
MIRQDQWDTLRADGFLRIPGACAGALADLRATVENLLAAAPHGYLNPPLYSGQQPTRREQAPTPSDRAPTVIIPHAGFLAPGLLRPLANPALHDLLERIVGRDFYLSNSWFQMVPPGTGRLAYHKDPRGSITLNILLDDIGPGMGSTCLVPGSHLNTPPPAACLRDILGPHPGEIDMTGAAGDLLLFSAETWHARSENRSDRPTRRLFYNFYSRSSRATTAWAGAVEPDRIEAARAALPPAYAHLFRLDPAETARLATVTGSRLRRWGFARSTSDAFWQDMAFAWQALGRPADHPDFPGFLLPYTTRLLEGRRFAATDYVSRLRPLTLARNTAGALRRRVQG